MAMTEDSIISRFNLKEPLYCFFPTFAVFLCKSCDPVTCETIIAMLKFTDDSTAKTVIWRRVILI